MIKRIILITLLLINVLTASTLVEYLKQRDKIAQENAKTNNANKKRKVDIIIQSDANSAKLLSSGVAITGKYPFVTGYSIIDGKKVANVFLRGKTFFMKEGDTIIGLKIIDINNHCVTFVDKLGNKKEIFYSTGKIKQKK